MLLFRGLLVSSLLALSACGNSGPGTSSISPADKAKTEGIYDGRNAEPSDKIVFSTVYIMTREKPGKVGICTGTILSSSVILTAAHCVVDAKTSKIYSNDSFSIRAPGESTQFQTVSQVVVDPFFFKDVEKAPAGETMWRGHDLALMKLENPLTGYFTPVQFPTSFSEIANQKLQIAGFGATQLSGDGPLNLAPLLSLGPVKVDFAKKMFSDRIVDADSGEENTITGNPQNTAYGRLFEFVKRSDDDASFCLGDSGGPLYYEKNGKVYQIAINVNIGFEASEEERKCVYASERQDQVSTSVLGSNAYFIAATYKSMTGQDLPTLKLGAIEKDPTTFEYYFANDIRTAGANKWIDLNGVVAVNQDTDPDFYYLIKIADAASACDDVEADTLANFSKVGLVTDGKTPVQVSKVKKDPQSNEYVNSSLLEARIQNLNGKTKMVVLTPDGFVSHDVPLVSCTN